ncbi:MAG: CTP synthase, partial [Lysinibacillus sp.]
PHEIIESRDAEHLYEVPLNLHAQDIDDIVLDHFGIKVPEADMEDWKELVQKVKNLKNKKKIALVGKYVELQDAYISVVEALKHAGYEYDADIEIDWINAEHVDADNVHALLKDADGVLVPGGFGDRGVEGKILATQYARENNVPFLGICLGMQLATVEFARNVLGLEGAHSTELDADTQYPIIDFLPDQNDSVEIGGTLRLGLYPCKLAEGTKAKAAYGQELVYERHRHRYEFNNEYREAMEAAGLVFSGTSPDGKLVEIIELPDNKFFVACQFHPELISRPNRPQSLFREFIGATF